MSKEKAFFLKELLVVDGRAIKMFEPSSLTPAERRERTRLMVGDEAYARILARSAARMSLRGRLTRKVRAAWKSVDGWYRRRRIPQHRA